MTIQKIIPLVLLALNSMVLIGCGGNEVLLRPDYSNRTIVSNRLTGTNIKAAAVIDRRGMDKNVIGSARVGMMNKTVPYRTAVPVADFVKTVIDSLVFTDPSATVVPVVAYIDTMEVKEDYSLFSERGIFDAKVVFGVPMTRDSLLYITTRVHEVVSSGIDVTDMLEPLIYQGIVNCGRQCVEKIRSMNVQWYNAPRESASTVIANAQERSSLVQTVEAVEQKPLPKVYSDIGLMYSHGKNIQAGYRISYNIFAQKESSLTMLGFGYNLEVLSIRNDEKLIEGTMVTFGGTFACRALLSAGKTTGYLGATFAVIFGNETIDYGNRKETSFFVGPILRETIGISFNKKVFLEFGLYEIKLFGSTMLPDDIGLTGGISVGI